jgi:hypothetical protein
MRGKVRTARTLLDEVAEVMAICKAGDFTLDGSARLLLANIAKHIDERGIERVGMEIREAARS